MTSSWPDVNDYSLEGIEAPDVTFNWPQFAFIIVMHCPQFILFKLLISLSSFIAFLLHCECFSGDWSRCRMSLSGVWWHFICTLILMNGLHKAVRQHSLSTVINDGIHYFFWSLKEGTFSFFPSPLSFSLSLSTLS